MADPEHQPSGEQATYSPEEMRHLRALGRAIGAIRVERTPYSAFKLAHRIDVHRNTLNAVKNGKTSVGFVVLLRIADGLGVSMSELMRVYEEMLENEPLRV